MRSDDGQCIRYTVSRALSLGSLDNLTLCLQHNYLLLDTTWGIRPFDFRCDLLMWSTDPADMSLIQSENCFVTFSNLVGQTRRAIRVLLHVLSPVLPFSDDSWVLRRRVSLQSYDYKILKRLPQGAQAPGTKASPSNTTTK